MLRTILVPLAEGLSAEPALDAALALARRLKSHIRATYIRPDPETALLALPEPLLAAGASKAEVERHGRAAAAAAKAQFEAWRTQQEIPEGPADRRLDSLFTTWTEAASDIEPLVTRFGAVSDLIVLARTNPNPLQAEHAFDAAVFGSGRPTLLVPQTLPWDMLDHIVIAWNGSREASRAVLGAMPLLHAASRVSIFCAPAPDAETAHPEDLADSLLWQGIRTHACAVPEPRGSTGAQLLRAVRKAEGTLIVMGAYTHSRLRQRFLGGVTAEVLAGAQIPLLMSH
jgi:nucleotide-binding universal stress UspA family protein